MKLGTVYEDERKEMWNTSVSGIQNICLDPIKDTTEIIIIAKNWIASKHLSCEVLTFPFAAIHELEEDFDGNPFQFNKSLMSRRMFHTELEKYTDLYARLPCTRVVQGLLAEEIIKSHAQTRWMYIELFHTVHFWNLKSSSSSS